MGFRSDHLKNLTNRASIHAYKAQEHLSAIRNLPRVISLGGGAICTITKASLIDGPLVLVCEFKKNGKILPFLTEPHDVWTISNPPILVEDPLGDVILNGETHREDPWAVLEEIISRMYIMVDAGKFSHA